MARFLPLLLLGAVLSPHWAFADTALPHIVTLDPGVKGAVVVKFDGELTSSAKLIDDFRLAEKGRGLNIFAHPNIKFSRIIGVMGLANKMNMDTPKIRVFYFTDNEKAGYTELNMSKPALFQGYNKMPGMSAPTP